MTGSPTHVLVAGGGVAGLEALLALRRLAGDRVELSLLSPRADFTYRPMAVAEPFGRGHAAHHALAKIAADLDVPEDLENLSDKGWRLPETILA